MTRHMAVLVSVIAVLGGSNVLVSSMLGLGDAEALYAAYGRHLSLAYLDHPPLIGWLIRAFTAVFGVSPLAVRLVSLCSMALTVLFLHQLTRDAFGRRAAMWCALLLAATPVFSVGMVAAAPDAPLAALWSFFLWQLHRQLSVRASGVRFAIIRPLGLGVILGLAFLAKYTGAALVLTTVWVLSLRANRHWLKRPVLYAAAGLAAVVALPVFIWNGAHDWAGVSHRLVWTQNGAGWSVANLGKLLGGQLLYLGPMTAVLFVAAVRDAARRRIDPRGPEALLLAAAVPALVLTYALSIWSNVAEPHWPAAGYLSLFPLTAGFISQSGPRIRRIAQIGVVFGGVVLVAAHVVVLTPVLPLLTPQDEYQPEYDLGNELRGWPEVADALRAMNPDRIPVVAAFYTQCSQLAFVLHRPTDPPVRCVSPEIDDFDLWYGPFELPEGGAFFVTDNRFEHDVGELFPSGIPSSPTTVETTRAGRWVRRFRIARVISKRK